VKIKVGDELRVRLECNQHYATGKVIETDGTGVFIKGRLLEDDRHSDWLAYVRRKWRSE